MLWRKPAWRSSSGMPAAVFLLGLCGAGAAGLWLQTDIDTQAQAGFQRSVDRVAGEIRQRFDKPLAGLLGARGLYAASPGVKRAQFRAYVESRDLPQEFPGVRGFGFIQRVMRAPVTGWLNDSSRACSAWRGKVASMRRRSSGIPVPRTTRPP